MHRRSAIILACISTYVYASPIMTSSRRQLADLGGLPGCASPCATVPFVGCDLSDAECLCTHPDFVTKSTSCFAQDCEGEDLQLAVEALEGFCMGGGAALDATSVISLASADASKVMYDPSSSTTPPVTTAHPASTTSGSITTATSAPASTTSKSSSSSKATSTNTSKAKTKNAAFSNSIVTYEIVGLLGAGVGVIGAALLVL